jgi:hypothetical protein
MTKSLPAAQCALLRCTTRRSPQSLSQYFPARKTSILKFHRGGSHILQKPPLMLWLGNTTCYSTKPTHINHVLHVVNMVMHSMNRSLGSQVDTTIIKWYTISTCASPHHHQHPPAWILRLTSCYKRINQSSWLTSDSTG